MHHTIYERPLTAFQKVVAHEFQGLRSVGLDRGHVLRTLVLFSADLFLVSLTDPGPLLILDVLTELVPGW